MRAYADQPELSAARASPRRSRHPARRREDASRCAHRDRIRERRESWCRCSTLLRDDGAELGSCRDSRCASARASDDERSTMVGEHLTSLKPDSLEHSRECLAPSRVLMLVCSTS